MTKKYNQTLPFIVVGIVVGLILLESFYEDVQLDVDAFIPVLTAIGVGGAAKEAITRAGALRKALPESLVNKVKEEIKNELKQK